MAPQISAHTRVRLANGAHVLQRSPTMLQFGLDATRTGIIETPSAQDLRPLIDGWVTPRQLRAIMRQLQDIMDREAAAALVADLLAYRVLVPDAPAQVYLSGTSPLSKQIARLLSQSGIFVRLAGRTDAEVRFLATAESWVPMVLVDHMARARALTDLTKRRTGAVLHVATVDSRVVIGPLRTSRADPCLVCLHLHCVDRDAGWELAVEQLPGGLMRPDPVVVAAGAALASGVIRHVVGVPDPPGVSAPRLKPGHVRIVDPFGPQLVRDQAVTPHPRCGVCYP
ncbi:hypothetical protein JZY91_02285 [Corynebacterium sp. CNCTC7651]|uniref:hypothetical protein n=1 Tax=Corynebacterium sp. CNCTC7651 TaxID=2815361 RepID=UPI001F36A653|nr:hypothetical protein [Corynebacterium sp. CNCTC7651]UIZ92641.1 hypothetical protein JZY91_02285 [Corynebacterium sp. CNCTC7651]